MDARPEEVVLGDVIAGIAAQPPEVGIRLNRNRHRC
jgi:hypothetical protein